MKTLRIPLTDNESDKYDYMQKDGYIEIPLTEECIYCTTISEKMRCSKCYGKGYVYTKTGQDIINFMEPFIQEIISNKMHDYIENERERRDRC